MLCAWQADMPDRWRRLVRRDAQGLESPAGPVWGAPYRWGCTLIAYRRDELLRCGSRGNASSQLPEQR